MPANEMTPTYFLNEAKKISKENGLKITVLDEAEAKKKGMGAFTGVAQGSDEPSFIIALEYNGNPSSKEKWGLVGKGITFDSGGLSLKPHQSMHEMKYDMCGAATVLAALQALAKLKMKVNSVGVMAVTENLPGGRAQRPGDIVRTYSGKTAEILNTDAEGRLVLGDALAYSKRFNPGCVIDFATLTGACVVSLGDVYAGLFSDDDELVKKLTDAGEKTGELVWRQPLHEKYKELVKSNVADIKNVGPREGGAITAAIFLKEFVDCKKWAHLDIAGTAYTKNNKNILNPFGGTGYGVRLALQLLEDWKNN